MEERNLILNKNQLKKTSSRVLSQGCQMVYVFSIWLNFGGPWNRKCLYILWPLIILLAIWCNLRPFGVVSGNLVNFPLLWYIVTRKNMHACSFHKMKDYNSCCFLKGDQWHLWKCQCVGKVNLNVSFSTCFGWNVGSKKI
jgi:hypothetical protein